MIMSREDYVDASLHRARALIRDMIPSGARASDYWLFAALEANKSIVRDMAPRPIQIQESPHYIEFDPRGHDCVVMSSLRKHAWLSGDRPPKGKRRAA